VGAVVGVSVGWTEVCGCGCECKYVGANVGVV